MLWSYLRRRNLSSKVIGQVHNNRLYSLIGSVAYMYLLLRTLTTVYIVKLYAIAIALNITKHKVVLAAKVNNLSNHLSTHTQQQRFVVALGINIHKFVVTSHCLCIVCNTHDKLAIGRNRSLRIFHIGATATHTNISDARWTIALVYYFKLGSCRRLIDSLSAVDNSIGCHYLLSTRCECHQ